jgi:hypothetical protein
MTSSSAHSLDRIRVRWWLLGLFLLLGLGGIAIGSWISEGPLELNNEQAAYWSGAAVSVGSSLLLAAVLVWFERALLVRVESQNAKVVERATAAASTAAEEAISRATESLVPRIDEIDKRLNERQNETRSEQDRLVETLGTVASRTAVLEAMSAASSIGALHETQFTDSGEVVIPCGDELNSPRVAVGYVPEISDPEFAHDARLTLAYVNENREARIEWMEGEEDDAVHALLLLQREMVKIGAGVESRRISAEYFFKNLQSLLHDAIQAREGDPGAWLSGARVREFVADGCVITDDGIEFEGLGIQVQPNHAYTSSYVNKTNWRLRLPERPDSIEPDLWEYSTARAQRYFRRAAR